MTLLSSFLPRGMVPVSSMFITSDTTLNYDTDLLALVVLVGSGGGGAAAVGSNVNAKLGATGGQGGAVAIQLVRMLANADYTIETGDPPSQVGGLDTSGTPQAYNGNQGGSTIFTFASQSPQRQIIAVGGYGGTAQAQTEATTTNFDLNNATGSPVDYYGEGADIIFAGGSAGPILSANGTTNGNRTRSLASGGGAANILGVSNTSVWGGLVWQQTNNGEERFFASGGGGVGGGGGNIISASTSTAFCTGISGGGGSGGPGAGVSYGASDSGDITGTGGIAFPFNINTLISPTGAGSDGENSGTAVPVDGGPGAGGGANNMASVSYNRGGHGGIFGGGGGCTTDNAAGTTAVYGGDGGYGGGGGGAATRGIGTANNREAYGGISAGGCALVFFLTDFGKVTT